MSTNDLMVYLKTTDNCNLNCDHCFTNGKNGKQGWFDIQRTTDFFNRLKVYHPNYDNATICFHGGEPLLAPPEMFFEFWENVNGLWDDLWWSVQSNLTFPLTDAKERILTEICEKSVGTSWDAGIRWPDRDKELLWESNVRYLAAEGHEITVMVCLTSNVLKMEPIDIINHLAKLGVSYINFERITSNGNATLHTEIFPSNEELDNWFLKLWNQSVEHKTWEYIGNLFFNSILTSYVYNTHAGCRSRTCEQKILTINADGTIGGCPNGAVDKTFGTINDDIETLMSSSGRMCNIQSEIILHPVCHSCPVYDICNGDCHQLGWQGNVCAAPKSLMQKIKSEDNIELYKEFLGTFVGQE